MKSTHLRYLRRLYIHCCIQTPQFLRWHIPLFLFHQARPSIQATNTLKLIISATRSTISYWTISASTTRFRTHFGVEVLSKDIGTLLLPTRLANFITKSLIILLWLQAIIIYRVYLPGKARMNGYQMLRKIRRARSFTRFIIGSQRLSHTRAC